MVYALRCPCFNITVHLTEKPSTSEAPQTSRNSPAIVISNKKQPALSPRGKKKFDDQLLDALIKQIKWKTYAIGELALAGVQISQPRLSQTFEITQSTNNTKEMSPKRTNSQDSAQWKACKCLNCNTDFYAIHESQPNTIVLNASVEQKSIEERLKEMPGYIYSKGYKILLQSNSEALNNVLECPDETDKQPFEAFSNLQTQLDQVLKEEHKLMEERIEAFKQEQLQLYNLFQTNTYSDRKILWYKICKTMDWDVLMNNTATTQSSALKIPSESSESDAASSQSKSTFKNLVIFEDYKKEMQSPAQTPPTASPTPSSMMSSNPNSVPSSVPNSQPKTPATLSKDLEDKLDRATVLFDFEEDASDAETQRKHNKPRRNRAKTAPSINIVSIDVPHSPETQASNGSDANKEVPVEEQKVEESEEDEESSDESEEEEQPQRTGTRTELHRQRSKARRLDFDDEDVDVDVDYDDGPKKVVESINLLGTSLPMAIPSKLTAAPTEQPQRRFNKEKDKEVIASRQFKVRSDDIELSKSFDVPVSQNRRLTEHIISLQNY